ncbi:MAG TPA: hypothetical protein VFO84_05960 [Dehalococcoidia bacterium]|nr:hypothetical protein [Dehalococcoidia bacterium]
MTLPLEDLSAPRLLLLAIALTILSTACGGDDDDAEASGEPLSDSATIEYRYDDASIPPEFHRSYELSISKDEADFVVDIYGDVVRDETVEVPPEAWAELANTEHPVFELEPEATEGDCAGATARRLTVTDGGDEVLDLDFEVCGGANDEAASVVDGYVQPLIDTIPDWGSFAPAPLDDYGDDPIVVSGTIEEVCRGGEAANRVGRASLAAYIDETWPEAISVLGYECRELFDPTTPGCDREFDPKYSDCWSTHAAGRAIDVVVGGEPDQPSAEGLLLGDAIVTAFLASRDGEPHYLARVTGVQEIIWNDRCWHPEDEDVAEAAAVPACPIPGHDNHVHLTLSEDGADGLTSWYADQP